MDIDTTVVNFKKIQDEGFELFKQKNADYGNAFEECGVIGILVRMNDKVKRMQNISKTSITVVNTESLRDTLVDLQNYATLAVLELDRQN